MADGLRACESWFSGGQTLVMGEFGALLGNLVAIGVGIGSVLTAKERTS